MDTETLVDREIEQGRLLVQALDDAGMPVVAALWSYLPEQEAWRLLIASPRVTAAGPRAAYAAIREVLLKSQIDLPFHCISAVGLDDPLVVELRVFAGANPAPFTVNTLLQKAVVGDTYIEGAYIYRAEPLVGNSGTFPMWSVFHDKARKVWTARRCHVSVEDRFFKKIEVEGLVLPQTQARYGINAHLGVLSSPEKRDGETYGDVERWTIHGGRLRGVETIARSVRIEGLSDALAAGATA